MTALQLGLFPGCEQILPDSRHQKRKPKQRHKPGVIEESCTTARAAELLDVSTTTLYRAKKEDGIYRRGPWTAEAVGQNAWKVTHDRI